ncbi:hypothetical protein [Streptomyces chartreusis]|uniref:hypothetical protein n=1 Tax=Streptomyces chartreusis TaxID=1969 RepID=UPI003D73FBBA
MTDRHATVDDLPDWHVIDTPFGLSQRPGNHAWIWLKQPASEEETHVLGRDMEGHLYVASEAGFADRVSAVAAPQGRFALLVAVEDGLALWLPRIAYRHIKVIDPAEPGPQPDVPHWLPIREVLKEMPDGVC